MLMMFSYSIYEFQLQYCTVSSWCLLFQCYGYSTVQYTQDIFYFSVSATVLYSILKTSSISVFRLQYCTVYSRHLLFQCFGYSTVQYTQDIFYFSVLATALFSILKASSISVFWPQHCTGTVYSWCWLLKCNSLTLADCLHRLEESVELILQLLLLLFLLFSFLALQLLKLDINISSHI